MPPNESTILTAALLQSSSLPAILPPDAFSELFPPRLRSHPQVKRLYRALQHRRGLVVDAVRENIADEVRRGEAQRREVVRKRQRDEDGEGAEWELDGGMVMGVVDDEDEDEDDDGEEDRDDDGGGADGSRREEGSIGDEDEDSGERGARLAEPTGTGTRKKRRRKGDGADEMSVNYLNAYLPPDADAAAAIVSTSTNGAPFSTSRIPNPSLSGPHTLDTIIPALESACRDVDLESERLEARAEAIEREIEATIGSLSDLRYGKLVARPESAWSAGGGGVGGLLASFVGGGGGGGGAGSGSGEELTRRVIERLKGLDGALAEATRG